MTKTAQKLLMYSTISYYEAKSIRFGFLSVYCGHVRNTEEGFLFIFVAVQEVFVACT